MRKITFLKTMLLAFVLLFGTYSVKAQTYLINEEFSGTLPTGWLQTNVTFTTVGGLTVADYAATTGKLTTVKLTNPKSLSFSLGRTTNTTDKTMKVNVSTTTQTGTFTTIATYNHSNTTSGGYITCNVDLSAYSNSEIFLQFEKASSTTSNWRIDWIKVEAPTICTSSNLSFSEPSISKIMGDAAFTIVPISLNGTTAITYASTNTAVATVNATTGEVTIVAAGTAKITATQAAGTHNDVDYCAATAEYTLNVVSVTPTITVTEVNVPAMTAFVDGTDTEVINVSGINLAESISLAISGTDAAQFALSANNVAQTDGTASNTAITISYNPTAAGSHTAILTISTAGAVSVTRALTGTATWTPLAVPFATAATGISSTGFSANWEAVTGATNYDLNVYTKTGNNEGFYNAPAAPSGWTLTGVTSYTATSIGLFGNSAPSVKFDDTNDVVVSPVYEVAPNLVSFWLRGASTNATSALLFQGYDGANWVTIENIQPLPTVGTIKVYNSTSTPALQNNFVQFRFTYAKSSGNVAFDDFGAYIVTPVLGSPFTVTGETSKEIAGLNPGTTYYYTVVAKNANVTSAVSNEMSVVTTDISTGVHNPLNNISVSVSGNNILFTAQAGQMVEVYNSIGQKLVSKRAVEGLNSIPVTARGVVLVKVGDRLAKVIM